MKRYLIILKESGTEKRRWSEVKGRDALAAIANICLNQKPNQEYVAIRQEN